MLEMPYYHDFLIVFKVLQVLFNIFSWKKEQMEKKFLKE